MIFRASSPGDVFRPIGTVWVPSDTANRSFETASWYEKIAYAGQTVVVYSNGYYVKWTVKGYVVDSYFGPYGAKTEAGTNRDHTFMPYAFTWAARIMEGDYVKAGFEFNLLPEYGVGCAPYQHDPSKTGYFITMPDAGHPLLVRREGSGFDQVHTYKVTWRGEPQDDLKVKRSDGFNGDTWSVATRRAAERLDLAL